jgi:hypothetical protein
MDKLDRLISSSSQLRTPNHVQPPPISRAEWTRVVGSRIAKRTEPIRLDDRGTLFVRTHNAAWANELSMLAEDIRAQLASCGFEVQALRFVVGKRKRVTPRRGKVQVKTAAPPNAELPERLQEQVQAVADPDLRGALAAAAAKTLSLKDR